jgi:hypothetical protein
MRLCLFVYFVERLSLKWLHLSENEFKMGYAYQKMVMANLSCMFWIVHRLRCKKVGTEWGLIKAKNKKSGFM